MLLYPLGITWGGNVWELASKTHCQERLEKNSFYNVSASPLNCLKKPFCKGTDRSGLESFIWTAGRVNLVLQHLNFPGYVLLVCPSSYLFHHVTPPPPCSSALLTFLFCIFTILPSSTGPLAHTVPSAWNVFPFPLHFINSFPFTISQLHYCFLRRSYLALCLGQLLSCKFLYCLLTFLYNSCHTYILHLCDFSVFFSHCTLTSPRCQGQYLV